MEYKKHAYCIIAHNEPDLLSVLISLLDSPYNDIFVHIDLKYDINQFKGIKANSSNLIFLNNRLLIEWGELSQVRVEYLLFKTAHSYGEYNYYHLLSGADLPIKSQEFIHKFMDIMNPGKQYVGYAQNGGYEKDIAYKTKYYHYFVKNLKHKPKFDIKQQFYYHLHAITIIIQMILRVNRKKDIELKKGPNWISINHYFMEYLLSKEEYVYDLFTNTLCPDEIFVQSILWNSPFKNQIYNNGDDEWNSSMRDIDWHRGNPYVWKLDDLDYLLNSKKLFARKFSSVSKELIEKLVAHINS